MINIIDKSQCCGCSACVQRCPKQCITMKEDEEGFLYPVVDVSKCINCNLCEKVCPLINSPKKILPISVLGVKNRNEEERMASSSGGVFIALAKKVIEKGGVVFGAVFDENWDVVHSYSETLEGVKPMMGSKYVQSRIGDCYCDVERFLKSGREVMFTGTPCQLTGLHNFLKKKYPNLLSVDCLCHGVPSPKVWRKYLNERMNQIVHEYNGTIEENSYINKISFINFRDKKLSGWKNFSFVIHGKSDVKKYNKNSFILESHKDNTFMKGFLTNVYLRLSCYNCRCKNGISHSDLTLADFWGIDSVAPDFYDNKGVSLILVNSEKGYSYLSLLDVEIYESSVDVVKKLNMGFREKTILSSNRRHFFKIFDNCDNIISLIERFSKPTLKMRFYNKINYLKRRLFK